MASQDTVTEGDVRRLLSLVDQAREQLDDWTIPAVVLSGLRDLVPCTDIAFQLADPWRHGLVGGVYLTAEQELWDLSVVATDDVEDQEAFWSAFWQEGGCSYPQDTGDYSSVLRRSDRLTDRAFDRTAMGSYMRLYGVRHELVAALPPQGGVDRRLLLFRHDGPDFSEREVLLVKLFRPHLLELHAEQQRRTAQRPALTPRQWEILHLVAGGASNTQVARALSLSEGTVRKHLENVFARLAVGSRTEAVARVAHVLYGDPAPGPGCRREQQRSRSMLDGG